MSKIRVLLGWLLVALATAGCSLNPQVDPPSALNGRGADGASGAPVYSGMGGSEHGGGAGFTSSSGGASQGGNYGAGGAVGQGGFAGSMDVDASAPPPDGGALVEGGADGGPDGAVSTEAGTTKDGRAD